MSDDENEASLAINGIPVGLLEAIGEGSANLSAVGLTAWDFERPYEPGSIGYDQGEDFEDEVNKEIKLEVDDLDYFGSQTTSSRAHDATSAAARSKRAREIDGLRPKKRARTAAAEPSQSRELSDVWPTFEKGKILNLTQLLKGQVHRKSRAQFPLSTGVFQSFLAPIN
jgi:transcription initiation factor TFIID subunit 1, fungi type